jgi:hypothetical protein
MSKASGLTINVLLELFRNMVCVLCIVAGTGNLGSHFCNLLDRCLYWGLRKGCKSPFVSSLCLVCTRTGDLLCFFTQDVGVGGYLYGDAHLNEANELADFQILYDKTEYDRILRIRGVPPTAKI